MLPSMLHIVCVRFYFYFISFVFQASSNLVNAELGNSLMDGWMDGWKEDVSAVLYNNFCPCVSVYY